MASAIFAQFTADSPYSLQSVPIFAPNCPFLWGDLDPHLTHDSLGPSKPITQTASRSVQPFLYSSPQSVPVIYNGHYLVFHHQVSVFKLFVFTAVKNLASNRRTRGSDLP